MNNIINPHYLQADVVEQLRHDYENAHPCKHLVLDNFLTNAVADTLYQNFPKMEQLNVRRQSMNEQKAEDYHFERFHPAFLQVRNVVQSQAFFDWMGAVTGIEGLMSVEGDSLGSGVHQGGNGSYVDIHIDINMNTKYNIWRRLNLLIYLNKHWKPEYGGDLELWDKEMTRCEKKVPCLFNKAVVFYTDDNSPHGYAKINVPEGETRKSFYTYFYTPVAAGVTFRDSKFLSRPDDSLAKKTLTNAKETVKLGVKSLFHKIGVKSLDFQDKN